MHEPDEALRAAARNETGDDNEGLVCRFCCRTNTPGGEAISLYVGIALSAVVWMVLGVVPGVLAFAGVVTGLSIFSKRRRHQSLMLDLGVSDDDASALAQAVRQHRLDHMFGSNELPALQARGQRLIDTARELRAKTS